MIRQGIQLSMRRQHFGAAPIRVADFGGERSTEFSGLSMTEFGVKKLGCSLGNADGRDMCGAPEAAVRDGTTIGGSSIIEATPQMRVGAI